MRIYKCFLNLEKEEKWLEEMSLQGLHFKRVTAWGTYEFEQGNPQRRLYRIDCRIFRHKDDFRDYTTLFTDSGWNYISSNKGNGGHYFYSTDFDENKDIFSDNTSKAQRNLRLSSYLASYYAVIFLPYAVLWLSGTFKAQKVLYLTPGLWEMKGLKFLTAFLFETPFALMRAFGALLPFLFILIPTYFYLRGRILYKKALREGK